MQTYMFETMSSELFNLIEGFFWIALGFTSFISSLFVDMRFRKFALFSAFILFTFGISDFMQVVYGSFFQPHLKWLFVWKIIDVAGLLFMVAWYIKLRRN